MIDNRDTGASSQEVAAAMRRRIIEALKTVHDPEIPVDIWELGLIYGIEVGPRGEVVIQMTLTAPACPVAEQLPVDVKAALMKIEGVRDVRIELVFDPPWQSDMMSESAKLHLGFM